MGKKLAGFRSGTRKNAASAALMRQGGGGVFLVVTTIGLKSLDYEE